ncbi:MAG: hypothetical protein KAG92_01415 [Deltaproteobacteria bacterium]|nr:hypothetical protein [Deltaproteobacteria bacterium]
MAIRTKKTKAASEKQKPVAYVNWAIRDENGDPILKSNRGFSLFDNEYLTLEEKALIELATDNDGVAVVMAELRIIIAAEKPDHLDISRIKLVPAA